MKNEVLEIEEALREIERYKEMGITAVRLECPEEEMDLGIVEKRAIERIVVAAEMALQERKDHLTMGDLYKDFSNTNEDMLVRNIERSLNTYGFDYKAYKKRFKQMHKTIQQQFMRLICETIVVLSEEEPDGRNAQAVKLARKLVPIAKDAYLPFI